MRKERLTTLAIVMALCFVLSLPAVAYALEQNYVDYDSFTNTYTVYPTGIDDTDNLQDAFDEAAATGPDSTIQLVEGTYLLTRTISAINFDGTFNGAGMDKTTLQTNGVYPFGFYPMTNMFDFYQGADSSLSFSDMTIRAIGEHLPILPSFDPGSMIQIMGEFPGMYFDPNEFVLAHVDINIERMVFEGELDVYPAAPFHYNPRGTNAAGVIIMGNAIITSEGVTGFAPVICGTQSITNCIFKNLAYGVGTLDNADLVINIEGNTLESCAQSIMLQDLGNTQAKVSNNRILDAATGVGVYHGYMSWIIPTSPFHESWSVLIEHNLIETSVISNDPAIPASLYGIMTRGYPSPFGDTTVLTVEVSHNSIISRTESDGIILSDVAFGFFGIKSLSAVVSSNTIVMEDSFWGGIYASTAHGAVVTNNVISGNGVAGIYIGVWGYPCGEWTILGNNVQNVGDSPYWGWSAGIWLGIGSYYCTVVGSKMMAFDEGFENTIVGVNNMGYPPGQDIADALEQKHEIMGLFRGF
ncbi:MAG: right-handed parallel beta-helix repeat-containing protein [Candidatus Thorarchaeota archaeon]|jgi:hypothetical protein